MQYYSEITQQNKPIETKLEAWLTFISTEDVNRIAELIKNYPEFKAMYDEVYEICCNIEEVMGMYSKELREMDKNTIRYMIEELQDEVDQFKKAEKERQEALKKAEKEKQEALDKAEKEKQEADKRILELEELLRSLENRNG